MKLFFLVLVFLTNTVLFGQIDKYKAEIILLENQKDSISNLLAEAQLQQIVIDLKDSGLPSSSYIEHSAMILEYDESHEQARWVSHIILPEISTGLAYRSNDFRIDPKVVSGTAEQTDYFLTDTLKNGKVEYDGYGYDRGHLAPSADFRWNAKALSESYYYSNMSPQPPEFNQEIWAELESHLRKYVISKNAPLIVITAPLLTDDLKKVERATNNLSLPLKYGKAVYDPVNKKMIAFAIDAYNHGKPLDMYALSVDDFEAMFGLNVFTNLGEELESDVRKEDWFNNLENGDVDPISFDILPRGFHNTLSAVNQVHNEATVCGQVVASRYSKKGHLWLNIDRHFPNQVFSIFIKKEDLVNFPYDLKQYVANKQFCFEGSVEKFSETPHINIKDENDLFVFKPRK